MACGCAQNTSSAVLPPLTLQQVRDHGFVVMEAGLEYDVQRDRVRSGVVCAGTLDECLAYMRERPWRGDSWPMTTGEEST
jgi:hypothetical protein